MNEVLTFLKSAHEILITLSAIAAMVGFNVFKNTQLKKSIDAKQDSIIDEIKNDLQELKNSIVDTQKMYANISKHLEDEDFNNNLKTKINQIVISIFNSYGSLLNNQTPIKSLILEGADQSYYYFKSIRANGFNNINIDYLREKATSVLRTLRSHHVGETVISAEISNKIKTQVAHRSIATLLSDLSTLKSGVYNGDAEKQFTLIALKFVESMIRDAIVLYLDEIKKYENR